MSFISGPENVHTEPQPVSRLLWTASTIVGVQTLLTYNCVLTNQGWYEKIAYPGKDFPLISMLCFSTPLSLVQVFLTVRSNTFSLPCRIRFSFVGYAVTGVIFTALVPLTGAKMISENVSFILCVLNIAALSIVNAILQSALMGFAGEIAPSLSAAAMFGQGIAGLIPFGISFIKGKDAESWQWNVFANYAVTILGTLISLYFAERVILRESAARGKTPSRSESASSIVEELRQGSSIPLGTILSKIKLQAFNVSLVFLVTLCIFPSCVVAWNPARAALQVGLFQAFDVIGRYSAGPLVKYMKPSLVLPLALVRVVFVPLFMLGQRDRDGFFLWSTTAGQAIMMVLFAFTNGGVGTFAMIFGPESVPPAARATAGKAMSSALVMGIFAGTLLALALQIGA